MADIPVITMTDNSDEEFKEESLDTQKKIAKNTEYFTKILGNLVSEFSMSEDKLGFSTEKLTLIKDNLSNILDTLKDDQKDTPKEKKYKKWLEKLRKNKVFESMVSGLKGIAESASNLFFDILKLLLIMMIIDPKGKMLASIIKFFGGMVVWFIKMLAKYIPTIVSSLVTVIKNVLPPVFAEIFSAILLAFSSMFRTWAKKVGEDTVLGKIFMAISKAFGEDGVLYKFFQMIAKLSPYIVAFFGAFAILFKYWKVFKLIGTAISFLIKGLGILKAGLVMLAGVIGWLPIIIIATIAIIAILVWKFRKQIVKGLKWVWDKLKEFGSILYKGLIKFSKFLYNIFISTPLKIIGILVKSFKKFFKWFKKIFRKAFDFIKKGVMLYVKFITLPYRMVWKVIQPLIGRVSSYINQLKNVLTKKGVKGLINKLVFDLKRGFSKLGVEIKLFFSSIGNFIATIMDPRNLASKDRREAEFATRQIASSYGIGYDDLKRISRTGGRTSEEKKIASQLRSKGLSGDIEKSLKSMSESKRSTISKKIISQGKSFQTAKTLSREQSSGD